jgi:hypothetical protein
MSNYSSIIVQIRDRLYEEMASWDALRAKVCTKT